MRETLLTAWRTQAYARQAWKMRNMYPRDFCLKDQILDYPAWIRSFWIRDTAESMPRPWLGYGVLRFFDRVLHPSMRVYEFGAGGSTLLLAPRVKELYSVEHNPEWGAKIQHLLERERLGHCHLALIHPELDPARAKLDPSDPENYVSGFARCRGWSFQSYVKSIDQHPDQSFDLIVIDGRARPSCLKHSIPKVKPGGYLLFDNSERVRYRASLAMVPASFRRINYPGPVAANNAWTNTTIWQAPGQ